MSNTEIVNGLHSLADFIDDNSWFMDTRPNPTVPLTVRYGVDTSLAVLEIAESAGIAVECETWDDGAPHTRATIAFGMVELVVFYIGEPPRGLVRPLDVTPILAEVEG